ncbi:hypothetical protein KR009_005772, partial [Drosophila setifemur]
MEDKLEKYWRRMFYLRPKLEPTPLDSLGFEYFGVLRIKDTSNPQRNLWFIYSCPQFKIAETMEKERRKYGKKNVIEIFRKPVYSGPGFRAIVRDYFSSLKWFIRGNVLEAPPKSYFNDEKFVKTVNSFHEKETRRIYDYIMIQHDWYRRYNDQKP